MCPIVFLHRANKHKDTPRLFFLLLISDRRLKNRTTYRLPLTIVNLRLICKPPRYIYIYIFEVSQSYMKVPFKYLLCILKYICVALITTVICPGNAFLLSISGRTLRNRTTYHFPLTIVNLRLIYKHLLNKYISLKYLRFI